MQAQATPPPPNQLLAPEELAGLVAEAYELGGAPGASFIRRGFNDHYRVDAAGAAYLARVYLNGKYYIADPAAFCFELELLEHLARHGVPVAAPIRRRDGALLGRVRTQAGERCVALFHFAAGRPLCASDLSVERAAQLGAIIARLHLAANSFHSSHQRYHLDLRYLLHEPLALIEREGDQQMRQELAGLLPAAELAARVEAMPRSGDAYGIIHADLHGGNMHLSDAGELTIFDFDHCAYGWRAYDLAPFHWGTSAAVWASFLAGYQALRPMSAAELESIPIFLQLRAIWDCGDALATRAVRRLPGASSADEPACD